MQMTALGLNVHPYHSRFIEAKWKYLLLRWFHQRNCFCPPGPTCIIIIIFKNSDNERLNANSLQSRKHANYLSLSDPQLLLKRWNQLACPYFYQHNINANDHQGFFFLKKKNHGKQLITVLIFSIRKKKTFMIRPLTVLSVPKTSYLDPDRYPVLKSVSAQLFLSENSKQCKGGISDQDRSAVTYGSSVEDCSHVCLPQCLGGCFRRMEHSRPARLHHKSRSQNCSNIHRLPTVQVCSEDTATQRRKRLKWLTPSRIELKEPQQRGYFEEDTD